MISVIPCTQTRDRTGMDFTPLVFETSASTDSAIWAFYGCKGMSLLATDQILGLFFLPPYRLLTTRAVPTYETLYLNKARPPSPLDTIPILLRS